MSGHDRHPEGHLGRGLVDRIVARPLLLLAIIFTFLLWPLLAFGPADPETGGAWALVAVAALGSLLLGLLILLLVALSGRDPEAEPLVAAAFGDDAVSVILLGRWLRRSRHFRLVGGLAGFVLSVGWWENGIGVAPTAIGTLGGVTVGGALAEVHSWRVTRSGPRIADLAHRHLLDYVRAVDVAALLAAAAAAAGLLARAAVAGRRTEAVMAALAIGVAAWLALMLRLVVLRPRPALDPALHRADELMRRLAATVGFIGPGIALTMILVATALDRSGAGTVVVVVLWLVGLGWYWRSRFDVRSLRLAAG